MVLPNLALSGIQVAIAMAVSSGAKALEAVALVADDGPSDSDLALVRDLPGSEVVVWWSDPTGAVRDRVEA